MGFGVWEKEGKMIEELTFFFQIRLNRFFVIKDWVFLAWFCPQVAKSFHFAYCRQLIGSGNE